MKRLSTGPLRRAGALILAAATATTLVACGSSNDDNTNTSGGAASSKTVTLAASSDSAPNGYDPLLYAQGQYTFFSALYDALFVTGTDGKVAPNLVTKSETSEDKLKLTLTLKDGVTFTDGSTLDSALVKQNLDRRTDSDLVSYGPIAKGGASEITDVATPDAKTVVITWAKPQASGQNALADEAGVIIGKAGVTNPDSLATTPVGSGPYTLNTGKTTRASTYTFDKNTKAWNAAAFSFDTVVYKVITDVQALANAVVSGQVDVAYALDSGTVAMVKSRQTIAAVGGTIVGFPVADKTGSTNKAFGDVRVRQALSYAIDRASIVRDLHPASRATAQLFPEKAVGFDPALDTAYAFNVDKAKQLLADAGYAGGFTIDQTVGGQPTVDQLAVQKQWQAIGVKLNFIVATSTDQIFAAAATQPLLFGPFGVGNQPEGFVAGVVVGGFMNLQKATDPDIQGALGKALGSSGADKEAALKALNAAITNKVWYLPIYEDFINTGYNAKKVAAPAYAGTNSFLVLTSIKPV
jgi:peptide/nickel transport system substrate-binding protein